MNRPPDRVARDSSDSTGSIDIRNLLTDSVAMPWAAVNEVGRIVTAPICFIRFALHGIRMGSGWRIYGMPMIQRYQGSRIEIGERLWIRSWRSSNPLTPNHPVVLATRSKDAVIRIGNEVGLTGTTIVATNSVSISDRVLIGSNSTIVDTDFHPIDWIERQRNPLNGQSAPIEIEEDVFIGMNCIILKGVRIGKCSVIGAGSVVSQSIPDFSVAAGNPAMIIKTLRP